MGTCLAIIAAVAVGISVGLAVRRQFTRHAYVYGMSAGYRKAARLALDHAQFELADTEGRSGQRLERARLAYDLAYEYTERAAKVSEAS